MWCAPGTTFFTRACFPRRYDLCGQFCTIVSVVRVRESSQNKWFDAYVLASPSGRLVRVEKMDTLGGTTVGLIWWPGHEAWYEAVEDER